MAGNSNESRKGIGEPTEQGELSDESSRGKPGKMATTYTKDTEKRVSAQGGVNAPQLTPAVQGHLGRQLRAVYTELVQEPMPDKFAKLLEALADTHSKKTSKPDQE